MKEQKQFGGKSIEELFQESGSIIELERTLNDFGFSFKSLEEYLDFISEKGCGKITRLQKERVVKSPLKVTNTLPGYTINVGGINYHLHGIMHGNGFSFHSRSSLSKEVIEKINGEMTRYFDPYRTYRRLDYLYEQGLGSTFNLDEYREILDPKIKVNIMRKTLSKLKIPLSLAAVAFFTLNDFLVSHAKSKGRLDPESDKLYELEENAGKDIRYQHKICEHILALGIPEPINLEINYLAEKNSKTMQILYLLLRPFAPSSTAERSLYIARRLIDYAQKKELPDLHLLCGAAHVSQVAYFLCHPDYSFDKLEEYRLKKSKRK